MDGRLSVPILGDSIRFPDPSEAREDGLIALGGDLTIQRMLEAYRNGIFPWSATPITWWSPDPRSIIAFEDFHISRRVMRKIRQGRLHVTFDHAFGEVVHQCSLPREGVKGVEATWIEPALIIAYQRLHDAGHAHSVECWDGKCLVGGAFGVSIGGFFAGESMFSRQSDASKIALWHLMEKLKASGFILFDTQVATPHTLNLGASRIPRSVYLGKLKKALAVKARF